MLLNLRDAIAYEAVVEWARPPSYGLKFLSSHDLEGEVVPKMLFAKSLWLARRRQGLAD